MKPLLDDLDDFTGDNGEAPPTLFGISGDRLVSIRFAFFFVLSFIKSIIGVCNEFFFCTYTEDDVQKIINV